MPVRNIKKPDQASVLEQERVRITERRERVARLYLRGHTQADIASREGVCQGTVSDDVKALIDHWTASALVDFNQAMQVELRRLNQLEERAWTQFERSCEDAEFKRRRVEESLRTEPAPQPQRSPKGKGKRRVSGPPTVTRMVPTKTVVEETREGRCGDPRFMTVVYNCIDARVRILGGYKNEKGGNTNQFVNINWGEMYARDEAADAIEAEIEEAAGGEFPALPSPEYRDESDAEVLAPGGGEDRTRANGEAAPHGRPTPEAPDEAELVALDDPPPRAPRVPYVPTGEDDGPPPDDDSEGWGGDEDGPEAGAL